MEYEKLKVVTAKVEQWVLDRIDEIARKEGKNRSTVVREILEEYFRMGSTGTRPYEDIHGYTDEEKLELFKRLGIELIETCKERMRKLERETLRPLSVYEKRRLTGCWKVNKAISELFRRNMEV